MRVLQRMNNHSQHYQRIYSTRGGILKGTPTFMGLDTNKELAEEYIPVRALLLGLLGRDPSAQEIAIINKVICLNLYPDIRIWTMRTGALSISNGAPFSSAYAASLAAVNSKIYGVQPLLDCAEMLRAYDPEEGLKPFVDRLRSERSIIPGYGRPLIPGPDERVIRLEELLRKEQWTPGKSYKLLKEIEFILQQDKGLYINYAGAVAALLADPPFNLDRKSMEVITMEMVHLPLLFSIVDIGQHHPKDAPLLPLKISDINYTGRSKR